MYPKGSSKAHEEFFILIFFHPDSGQKFFSLFKLIKTIRELVKPA